MKWLYTGAACYAVMEVDLPSVAAFQLLESMGRGA